MKGEGDMVASHSTVDEIIKILLKHMDLRKAKRLARDLHNHVRANKSVTDTFSRIAQKLEEEDGEH